jgi:hypothetical protein
VSKITCSSARNLYTIEGKDKTICKLRDTLAPLELVTIKLAVFNRPAVHSLDAAASNSLDSESPVISSAVARTEDHGVLFS